MLNTYPREWHAPFPVPCCQTHDFPPAQRLTPPGFPYNDWADLFLTKSRLLNPPTRSNRDTVTLLHYWQWKVCHNTPTSNANPSNVHTSTANDSPTPTPAAATADPHITAHSIEHGIAGGLEDARICRVNLALPNSAATSAYASSLDNGLPE
ncbi:hypothetical protein HGRIS_001343 [Hohenbuehelia grisea]|uniref:Uncharacterized protein n=1 Tax=Hohenbuehelia grisea TaxID=104357 RepID=A0ABR3JP77_9AGAR